MILHSLRALVAPFFRKRFVLAVSTAAVITNISTWALVFFAKKPQAGQPPQIALHYNPLYGPDVYGTWGTVMGLPALGLVVIAVHLILGVIFFRKEPLAAQFLAAMALVFQICLLISVATVYYINLPVNS